VSDISAIFMMRASLRNNRACRKNDGNAMGIGFRLQQENKSNEYNIGLLIMNTNVYNLFDKSVKREERRVLDSHSIAE